MSGGYFIAIFHYNGYFVHNQPRRYLGGKVASFDADTDRFSLPELKYVMDKKLHVHDYMQFYYLVPMRDLDTGLRYLYKDDDFRGMFEYIPEFTHIDIFVEHIFQSQVESCDIPEPVLMIHDANADSEKNGDEQSNEFGDEFDDEQGNEFGDEQGEDSDFYNDEYGDDESGNDSDFIVSQEDNNDDVLYKEHVDPTIEEPCLDDETNATNYMNNNEEDSDEEIRTPVGSDEEAEEVLHGYRLGKLMVPKIGLVFSCAKQFKEALRDYSLFRGYNVKFRQKARWKITATCEAGCPWRVYASGSEKHKEDHTLIIRTIKDEHTCVRPTQNRNMKSSWLAKNYIEQIKINPKWKFKEFSDTVRNDFHLEVSRSQVYRARKKATDEIHGSYDEQYNMLREYAQELRRSNEGTSVQLVVDRHSRFKRIYICLDACKRGFLAGCRPFIHLDACHLKGPCRDLQLMAAIGVDGNNDLWPLAYAVTEGETKDSWIWFLRSLVNDIGTVRDHGWTFMSDQQKGLVPACATLFPDVEHRYCLRHLYGNFKAHFKGKKLKDLMMYASKTTIKAVYEGCLNEIKEEEPEAYDYLVDKDPRHWCRHAFGTRAKSDCLLNNLAESFNAMVKDARDQPILNMLEEIRRKLMVRIQEKKTWISNYHGPICPKIQNKVEKIKYDCRVWSIIPNGGMKYEIRKGKAQFSVDLDHRTCSCYRYQLSGIPCVHAKRAILFKKLKAEDFVDEYYHRDTYLKTYEFYINPVTGQDLWPISNLAQILPPPITRQPGRPKVLRKRDADEPINPYKLKRQYSTISCSRCGTQGHNARTCKGPIKGKGPVKGKATDTNQNKGKGLVAGKRKHTGGGARQKLLVRRATRTQGETCMGFKVPEYTCHGRTQGSSSTAQSRSVSCSAPRPSQSSSTAVRSSSFRPSKAKGISIRDMGN